MVVIRLWTGDWFGGFGPGYQLMVPTIQQALVFQDKAHAKQVAKRAKLSRNQYSIEDLPTDSKTVLSVGRLGC